MSQKQMECGKWCCFAAHWQAACVWSAMEEHTPNSFGQIDWSRFQGLPCGDGGTVACSAESALRRVVSLVSHAVELPTPDKIMSTTLPSATVALIDPTHPTIRIVTVTTVGESGLSMSFADSPDVTESRASRLVAPLRSDLITVRVTGDSDRFPRAGVLSNIASYGITVLGTKFVFLYASNSQMKERGGVFLREGVTPPASFLRIRELGIHDNPFKVLSRIGLLASSDIYLATIDEGDYGEYPDVFATDGELLTDGVGLIDRDYALKKGLLLQHHDALQFRFQGMKGVLLGVQDLQTTTPHRHNIVFRPSHVKFKVDDQFDPIVLTGMAVLRRNEHHPASANREMIQLLEVLEGPNVTVRDCLEDLHHTNVRKLLRVLESQRDFVDVADTTTTARMVFDMRGILRKFDGLMLVDPWWQGCLRVLYKHITQKTTFKFSFPIPDGAHLLGAADPFGVLKEGEVFVATQQTPGGPIKYIENQDVVVFRNPCVHPGDVRRLRAVAPDRLVHAGYSNLILFPTTGSYSIPAACSGGDLDGDDFTVIWDHKLVDIKQEAPLDYSDLTGHHAAAPQATADVGRAFEAVSDGAIGRISNMHATLCALECDGARSEMCKALAKSQSVAVDFPKTGLAPLVPDNAIGQIRFRGFPHFLGNKSDRKFRSATFLGKLFDYAQAFTNDMHLGSPVEAVVVSPPNPAHITHEVRDMMMYFATKMKQAVRHAGLERPEELFLGVSLEDKYLERSDRLRIITHRAALCDEFTDRFQQCRDGLTESERAAAWFVAASEAGVGALGWLLNEHLVPTSSGAEFHAQMADDIRQFSVVPEGESPPFDTPLQCPCLSGPESIVVATAILRLVNAANVRHNAFASPQQTAALLPVVREVIVDIMARTDESACGGVPPITVIARAVISAMSHTKHLGGAVHRGLIRLQHALTLSRSLAGYAASGAVQNAIPVLVAPKTNFPQVASFGYSNARFQLVPYGDSNRSHRVVMLTPLADQLELCPEEVSSIVRDMLSLSEGVITNSHFRRLKVHFGYQLFGNHKIPSSGQVLSEKELRTAIRTKRFRTFAVDYDGMVPLPRFNGDHSNGKSNATKKHLPVRQPTPPVEFLSNLPEVDVEALRNLLHLDGYVELADEPFDGKPAMRFTVKLEDSREAVNFDWDAKTQSVITRATVDEVQLTSTMTILGGKGLPPDARLKLNSRVTAKDGDPFWNDVSRPLLQDLCTKTTIEGTRTNNLGLLRSRRDRRRYRRSLGLQGPLSSITITAVITTTDHYEPIDHIYSKPTTEHSFALEVSCFDGSAPLTRSECEEVLVATLECVRSLQIKLPQHDYTEQYFAPIPIYDRGAGRGRGRGRGRGGSRARPN